ncbi:MAG: tyrosine-type recombinase/integrase [Nitrososphaeraceae archaeon]
MFTFSEETTRIHRYIEKLPRVQQFLTSKQRGSVYRNIGYKTALVYLQQFVVINYSDLNLDTIIDSISPGIIDVYKFLDKFVAFFQTKKLSQASINQYLNYVKSYLQYHDVDIVPHKFKKRVLLPKIPREDEQPIDQNDIRAILLQCHNRRLKTYLLVLASCGVRPIEACAIRVCDINFGTSPTELHIRAGFTKTKRSRDIFISDEASRSLKEWIEYRFRIDLSNPKNINREISESLVFQIYDIGICKTTPQSIYKKLVQRFHNVLVAVDFDQRKDGMPQRRKITLHSFRRFVKTTISDSPAGSDYSEWFLGHKKSSYYNHKPRARSEIYASKCMKYLTFLDYSTLQATGRSLESRINEIEQEKYIMSQKHEEELKTMREQMDRIMNMIQQNPQLADKT